MTRHTRPADDPPAGVGSDACDPHLIERIRAGHAASLEVLMDRHWVPLVSYAARLLGSWDAAADAVQETFIRVWERREAWTTDGSVRALLYQITRNVALDERKHSARRASWLARRRDEEAPRVPTPSEYLQAAELGAAFRRAVAALPERRREVFLLARTSGLSYREIGHVMGISPQTVANHLSTAFADLRVTLQPFFDEPACPPPSSVRRG